MARKLADVHSERVALRAVKQYMDKYNYTWEKAIGYMTNEYKKISRRDNDTTQMIDLLDRFASKNKVSDIFKELHYYTNLITSLRKYANDNDMTLKKLLLRLDRHFRKIPIFRFYESIEDIDQPALRKSIDMYKPIVDIINSYAKRHSDGNYYKTMSTLKEAYKSKETANSIERAA